MKQFISRSTAFIAALSVLVSFSPSAVLAATERQEVVNNQGGVVLSIPAHAVEVADNVFSLGEAYDEGSGQVVEGFMIIHPKSEKAKGGGSAKPKPTASSCYTYLASGAKWKGAPEPWVVNASNDDGMSEISVFEILQGGIAKWEDAAAYDILGQGSKTNTTLVADETAPDGANEVFFASLADDRTIAVTIVWGFFGGAPQNRQLIEWDQVYNSNYSWTDSIVSDPNAMDFDNIATHELGHSVGMGDLYNSSCTAETMYGYSTEGDISKRDLNAGDIAGISKLY